MIVKWSNDETSYLKELIESHDRLADIHRQFSEHYSSRSYESIRKKIATLKDESDTYEVPIRDISDDELEYFYKESTSLKITAPSTQLVRQNNQAAKEFLHQLAVLDSPAKRRVRPKKSNKSSLVIFLSDLHFGKSKKSAFNMAKAHEMLSEIPGKLRVESEAFDEIVLCLGGDIIEGEDIYSSQGTHLECSVIEQACAATESIWSLALSLEGEFGVPVRIVSIPGNHGRMSKTANEKSNWDNVVNYMLFLTSRYAANNQIKVDVNFEPFLVVRVKDKNCLMYHHGTKHLGTPAMKIKFAGWIINKDVDLLMHGHWHKWSVETYLGRPKISNGTLAGPDDLSERMAEEEPPRQSYFMVTPGKPIDRFSFLEW